MNVLIVFHSRTGITAKVSKLLETALTAAGATVAVEEIIAHKDYSGALGYAGAAKDAMLGKTADIEPPQQSAKAYDALIIASPVWAFTVTPPIRAWLASQEQLPEQLSLVATMGGRGDQRMFTAISELAGKTAEQTLTLIDRHVKKDAPDVQEKINAFAARLMG